MIGRPKDDPEWLKRLLQRLWEEDCDVREHHSPAGDGRGRCDECVVETLRLAYKAGQGGAP